MTAGYISYPTATLAGVGALSNLICVIDLADAFNAAQFDWADVRSDGGNIYVTDDADVRMPAYIETIDTTAETGVLWIRKPGYDGGTSSTVRIHVDDLAVTAPAVGAAFGRNEVFQDNFHTMLFQNGTPEDVTGNYGTMTDTTTVTGTAGKHGAGFEFNSNRKLYNNAIDDYLGEANMVVSGWMKFKQSPGGANTRPVLASEWDALNTGNRVFSILLGSTNIQVNLSSNGNASDGIITFTSSQGLNTWDHYVWVKNGVSNTIYKNGVSLGTQTVFFSALYQGGNAHFSIGSQFNNYGGTSSEIDTHMMSLNPWSAAYVKAIYENQNNPASFWAAPTWVPAGSTATPSIIIPRQVITT
jgi:hypothetical protein